LEIVVTDDFAESFCALMAINAIDEDFLFDKLEIDQTEPTLTEEQKAIVQVYIAWK